MKLTPTEWATVEDKEKFIKRFKRFVEKDFPFTLFTKDFYQRMSMMRGHIAHYNIDGFYREWFVDARRRAEFLHRWTSYYIVGDPAWTWSDVELELQTWLIDHPEYIAKQQTTYDNQVEAEERADLARLKAKYEKEM